MDIWIAENIFKIKGVGYYGPPHPKATHAEMVLCKNWEEAKQMNLAAYPTPSGKQGHASGEEMAASMSLCYYRKGWGPIVVPEFKDMMYDTQKLIDRMVETNCFSYGCWTMPTISSVGWGWTAAFRTSVYPPEYHAKPGIHDTWYARDEKWGVAVCSAAKAAYLAVREMHDRKLDETLQYLADQKGSPYAD